MTARRPSLAIAREGNPGHLPRSRLDAAPRLPVEKPLEPQWHDWFPGRTGDRARNGEHTRARRIAARTWRNVVDELHRAGLISRLDAALLQDLAVATAELDQLQRRIHRDGGTVEGQKGNQVKHPLWSVVNQLRAHLRRLWAEVGVGPVARDRLPNTADEDDDDDPWD